MNTLILLGLSAMLAAEPEEPWSSSSSGSRQAVEVVLQQCAIGSKYGLDGDLLRLYPLGKWDPLPNDMGEGAYRWEGNPADYAQAIRELPGNIRVALTLTDELSMPGDEASLKEPSDRAHSVALLKHLRGAANIVEINLFGKLTDADLAEVRDLPGLAVLKVNEDPERRLPSRPGTGENVETLAKPRVWITDAGLAGLKDLPALTELTLTRSQASGVGLAGLTRLKSLSFGSGGLTEEGIKAIGQLPNLEQLSIGVADDALLAHLARLSKLRQLTLGSSRTVGTGITGSGLQYLAGLENLRELKLSSCYGITPSGLESLAALKHLQRLDLRNTWSDAKLPGETLDEMMVAVGRVTSLRELTLPDEVGDAGLARLESLRDLRSFTLSSTRVTDDGLKSVGKMVALEDFSIRSAPLTDQSLAHLRTLRNLRRFSLPSEVLTGPALKYLPEIGKLESLRLPSVPSESLAVLPRLACLQSLTLQEADGLAMDYVGRCANLETFQCYKISLDSASVEALSRLPKLRNVEFVTDARDHEVASIAQLTNLEGLSLTAPNAGPETVAAIVRLTKLEGLYLADVAMTDEDVRKFRALRNLRGLWISYLGEHAPSNSPSDAALASLWDDLPELKIAGPRSLTPVRKGEPLKFRASY